MTIAVFLAIQFSAYTITGLGAEAIAGIASLVAVAIVTTMVLWMKTAAAGLSGELRTEMARALETGSLAVLLLAFLAVGREGVETALFMVGYAEAETAWPLVGLVHRRARRRGDRLRHVRRRHPPQPEQVLHLHRDLPDRRRRRNPVLRHRRPADGRLAARSEQQGVRHHVRGSTGRPGTARSSRASSTSRPPRPSCSSRRGSPTSSSCSRSSCARPRPRPSSPDSPSTTSEPTFDPETTTASERSTT